MKVLALDLATKCGWKTGTADGVWNFKTKPYESNGMRLVKFKANLKNLHEAEGLEVVFYEKPGGRNYSGVKAISNFEGVLQEFCLTRGIDYRGFSAGEIKRHAKETYQNKTGEAVKGNLNKKQMIKFAKECLQENIIDDNHADALWLYDMAVKQFNLG